MNSKTVDQLDEETFRKYLDKFLSDARRRQIEIPELTTLRDDKLKLEIAVRDFLRATDMHSLLTQAEFNEARDTLAAMVNKGDE